MIQPTRPNISKGATYPPEFREEAVRYWLSSGQTLSAVAGDLGLSPQCRRDWRKSLDSDAHLAFETSATKGANKSASDLDLARENGQLRRELEAMTSCPEGTRRAILKKAISIFSDDKRLSGGLK